MQTSYREQQFLGPQAVSFIEKSTIHSHFLGLATELTINCNHMHVSIPMVTARKINRMHFAMNTTSIILALLVSLLQLYRIEMIM